jgi:hypothetical protein
MESEFTLKDSRLTPAAVSFHNKSGITVGRFIIEDEELKFEGNADKSAKIFIKLVLNRFNKKK